MSAQPLQSVWTPAAPLVRSLSRGWRRLARAGIGRGLPPSWLGYRWLPGETVQHYFARRCGVDPAEAYEQVHPETPVENPLPCNIVSRDELPSDRGWWGYSFRDVPSRVSGETLVATLTGCTVICYRDAARGHDFYPAIMTRDGRGLELREMRFRPGHAAVLRRGGPPVRLERATWILERVYHNHSHWLTAHLPKILLLRQRQGLEDVLLPRERTPAMDGSLRLVGLAPEEFRSFDPAAPLVVDELTIVGTDRFRPELLRMVPEAIGVQGAPAGSRRVFISRASALRRRLLNEDEIWPILAAEGFERVEMEHLSFESQVAVMQNTAVLVAPHGAGLTNMMFCPLGTHVVEIADLGFPNPNFYALASAMRHKYWLLPARSSGDGHPLEKDLWIEPELVRNLLTWIVR